MKTASRVSTAKDTAAFVCAANAESTRKRLRARLDHTLILDRLAAAAAVTRKPQPGRGK
jgi:hypothetical protein